MVIGGWELDSGNIAIALGDADLVSFRINILPILIWLNALPIMQHYMNLIRQLSMVVMLKVIQTMQLWQGDFRVVWCVYDLLRQNRYENPVIRADRSDEITGNSLDGTLLSDSPLIGRVVDISGKY